MDGKKTIFWLILVTFLFVFLEIFSVISSVILKGALPSLIWRPSEYTDIARIEDYLETRDPLLGWPSADQKQLDDFDGRGSRMNFLFPETEEACVSTYGDSFTWSDEVEARDSWQNALSAHLQCRVENFGFGGYGIGQAVMRHQHNLIDEAPTAVLTIVPYNTYRNLNRMRSLIQGGNDPLSLKPRFHLADGDLEWLGLPELTVDEIAGLAEDPWLLEEEVFLPGSDFGPVYVRFPFSKLWLDLAMSRQFRDRVETMATGRPHWADFYTPGHKSGAFELMVEIVRRFSDNARERGQTPIVLMLPDSRSIQYNMDGNDWEYQPLLDIVDDMGIAIANTGPNFIEALDGKDFCTILTSPDNCTGHFNPEGYALFGSIVHDILQEHELAP